ncbi:MAG TPA: M20/M25/M40 family metallo-hydrolase [Roseomonas sp.]|nr:M20/M25/M40 family metallo-hydrolase [Roseomonas sp.]
MVGEMWKWIFVRSKPGRRPSRMCVMATAPEVGMTKIAGAADFKLDVHSVDQAALDLLFRGIPPAGGGDRGHARRALRPRPRERRHPHPGGPCPDRRARRSGTRPRHPASEGCRAAGGHDASALAKTGIPAAMLFVRNQNGSHNPAEAMHLEDFDAACRVLMRLASLGPA